MDEKIYEYSTQSLDEFAVALALGAEIASVDDKGRFFTFHLRGKFNMETTMLSLSSKTLEINAYALCDSIRRAKSVIHRRQIP